MYCSFLSSLVQAGGNMIYLLLVLSYHCSLRSDCKINDISADFITTMKCREMQGKRVNVADNEIFENLP